MGSAHGSDSEFVTSAESYFVPCAVCLSAQAPNAGGAHPLRHVAAGDWSLCVDEQIADELARIWHAGLATSNSCQAWGEWCPLTPGPYPARVDFPDQSHARLAAKLLQLREPEYRETLWGHWSLLWYPGRVVNAVSSRG